MTNTTEFTITEQKIETSFRIKFAEPIVVGQEGVEFFEMTSASISRTIWSVDPYADENDQPVGTPYDDVVYWGWRTNAKGKRDGRQSDPQRIPSRYVPAEIRETVEALVQ